MPGIISDIKIKEGDVVKKNMPLMTIEAMKMEDDGHFPGFRRCG